MPKHPIYILVIQGWTPVFFGNIFRGPPHTTLSLLGPCTRNRKRNSLLITPAPSINQFICLGLARERLPNPPKILISGPTFARGESPPPFLHERFTGEGMSAGGGGGGAAAASLGRGVVVVVVLSRVEREREGSARKHHCEVIFALISRPAD